MHSLLPAFAALAVSTIFVLWQSYHAILQREERVKRNRVAFMLWVAAQQSD
jgi:hypothetical protein